MTQPTDPALTAAWQAANQAVLAPTWDRPADQLRSAAAAKYEQIRNNPGLTPIARQALTAQVYVRLQAGMAALQQRSGTTAQTDVAAMKRRLFGIEDLTARATPAEQATMAISFRDAQDRVSRLENESDALALLATATDTGDELLARAIGNAALTSSFAGFAAWPNVIDTYLASRPDKNDAYEQLREALRPQPISVAWEFVVPVPDLLNGVTPSAIPMLAANADRYRSGIRASETNFGQLT